MSFGNAAQDVVAMFDGPKGTCCCGGGKGDTVPVQDGLVLLLDADVGPDVQGGWPVTWGWEDQSSSATHLTTVPDLDGPTLLKHALNCHAVVVSFDVC